MAVPRWRLPIVIVGALILVLFLLSLAACSGDEGVTTNTNAVDTPNASLPATPPSEGSNSSTPVPPGGQAPGTEAAELVPALEQEVREAPENLEALGQLGIAYFQTQSYAQAEETYKKMLDIQDSAEVHNYLGNVYRDWQKTDQAIEQYERAAEIDPGLAVAYGNLAALYMMSGQIEQAIEVTEKGVANTTGAGRQQLETLLDSLQ